MDKSVQTSGRVFDTTSNIAYGVEYEKHFDSGLSIGAEIFAFENNFTSIQEYTAETDVHMFNVKYYFNNKEAFRPFIGAGIGIAIIAPTGEYFIDTHSGSAYQYVVGATYRFKYVGIYAEYKNITAELEDEFGPYTLSEIDASGNGIAIGVNVLF